MIRSSGEHLVEVFTARGFHEVQSPENPGRFPYLGVPHR